jgi:hypothetical protein
MKTLTSGVWPYLLVVASVLSPKSLAIRSLNQLLPLYLLTFSLQNGSLDTLLSFHLELSLRALTNKTS